MQMEGRHRMCVPGVRGGNQNFIFSFLNSVLLPQLASIAALLPSKFKPANRRDKVSECEMHQWLTLFSHLLTSNGNKICYCFSPFSWEQNRAENIQEAASHLSQRWLLFLPFKMTNITGNSLYQLSLININSVSNLMASQNKTRLLQGLCVC